MRSRAGRLTKTRWRMGLAGRWPAAAALGVLVSVLVVGALLLARSPADRDEPAAAAQVAPETETAQAAPEAAPTQRAPDPAAPGPEPEPATRERAPDPATPGPEPEAATSDRAPEPTAPDPEPALASADAEQAAPAPAPASEETTAPDPAEEPAATDEVPAPSEEPSTAGESIPVRGGVTLTAGPEYTEAAARAAVAAALARSAEVASPVVAVLPAPRLAPSRTAVSPPRLVEAPPPATESPPPSDDPSPASLAAEALPTAPPAAAPPAAPAAEATAIEPPSEAPPALSLGQPLGNLAPDVVDLLLEPPGEISVAMIDLRRNLAFTHRGDVYFDLASVSKVPLMLTVLREREREERALTQHDRRLLEVMIQSSNNEAASTLWDEVSGQVPSLLFDSELWPGILLPRGWGLWTGTAEGVARVFQEIVAGDWFSPDVRDDAMGLLDGVVHWQRWGVSAGLPDDGATVALKNGWYPQKAGWIVHSAGYVLDAGGRPDYVLVILSRHNPTLEDGIALLEEIAAGLHAALRPTVVSAGLQQSAR